MKQTNRALTFLMAAYRAIYARAVSTAVSAVLCSLPFATSASASTAVSAQDTQALATKATASTATSSSAQPSHSSQANQASSSAKATKADKSAAAAKAAAAKTASAAASKTAAAASAKGAAATGANAKDSAVKGHGSMPLVRIPALNPQLNYTDYADDETLDYITLETIETEFDQRNYTPAFIIDENGNTVALDEMHYSSAAAFCEPYLKYAAEGKKRRSVFLPQQDQEQLKTNYPHNDTIIELTTEQGSVVSFVLKDTATLRPQNMGVESCENGTLKPQAPSASLFADKPTGANAKTSAAMHAAAASGTLSDSSLAANSTSSLGAASRRGANSKASALHANASSLASLFGADAPVSIFIDNQELTKDQYESLSVNDKGRLILSGNSILSNEGFVSFYSDGTLSLNLNSSDNYEFVLDDRAAHDLVVDLSNYKQMNDTGVLKIAGANNKKSCNSLTGSKSDCSQMLTGDALTSQGLAGAGLSGASLPKASYAGASAPDNRLAGQYLTGSDLGANALSHSRLGQSAFSPRNQGGLTSNTALNEQGSLSGSSLPHAFDLASSAAAPQNIADANAAANANAKGLAASAKGVAASAFSHSQAHVSDAVAKASHATNAANAANSTAAVGAAGSAVATADAAGKASLGGDKQGTVLNGKEIGAAVDAQLASTFDDGLNPAGNPIQPSIFKPLVPTLYHGQFSEEPKISTEFCNRVPKTCDKDGKRIDESLSNTQQLASANANSPYLGTSEVKRIDIADPLQPSNWTNYSDKGTFVAPNEYARNSNGTPVIDLGTDNDSYSHAFSRQTPKTGRGQAFSNQSRGYAQARRPVAEHSSRNNYGSVVNIDVVSSGKQANSAFASNGSSRYNSNFANAQSHALSRIPASTLASATAKHPATASAAASAAATAATVAASDASASASVSAANVDTAVVAAVANAKPASNHQVAAASSYGTHGRPSKPAAPISAGPAATGPEIVGPLASGYDEVDATGPLKFPAIDPEDKEQGNGFDTPDGLAAPQGQSAPQGSIAPDATANPDAVAVPDATANPDAVAVPDAMAKPDAVQQGGLDNSAVDEPVKTIELNFNQGVNAANYDYTRFVVEKGTRIELDLSRMSDGDLSISEADEIADVIVHRDQNSGLVSIKGTEVNELGLDDKQGRIDLESIRRAIEEGRKGQVVIGNYADDVKLSFETDKTASTVVTDIKDGDKISGGWKALQTDIYANSVSVTDNYTLKVHGTDEYGNIIGNEIGQTVNVKLPNGSRFIVASSGNVGDITGPGQLDIDHGIVHIINRKGEHGDIAVDSFGLNGARVEVDEVTAKNLKALKSTINATDIKIEKHGSFESKNTDIKANKLDLSEADQASINGGKLNITILSANDLIVNDKANVYAQAIELADVGSIIRVGGRSADAAAAAAASAAAAAASNAAASASGSVNAASSAGSVHSGTSVSGAGKPHQSYDVVDGKLSGSASDKSGAALKGNEFSFNLPEAFDNFVDESVKLVADTLSLKGGTLHLDHGKARGYASVFTKSVEDKVAAAEEITKLSGNIVVGRNSAFGIGPDADRFYDAIDDYIDGPVHQMLTAAASGSAAAADPVAAAGASDSGVNNGTNAALAASSRGDDLGSYMYVDRSGIDLNGHKIILGDESEEKIKEKLQGDQSIYLGKRSAMQLTTRALSGKHKVFVNMDGKTVGASDGMLIVPAAFRQDEMASVFEGDVQLASGDSLFVTTENGLFTGVIKTTAQLQGREHFDFTMSSDSRRILSNLSDPTYAAAMVLMSDQVHIEGMSNGSMFFKVPDNANAPMSAPPDGAIAGNTPIIGGNGSIGDVTGSITTPGAGTGTGSIAGGTGNIAGNTGGAGSAVTPGTGTTVTPTPGTGTTVTPGTGGAVTPGTGGLDGSLAGGGTTVPPVSGPTIPGGSGHDTVDGAIGGGSVTTPSTGNGALAGNGNGADASAGGAGAMPGDPTAGGAGALASSGGGSGAGSDDSSAGTISKPDNSKKIVVLKDSAGYQFLRDALGSKNYQSIDQAARLATFGGALQAVKIVSSSGLEAMNYRLGFGKGANLELMDGVKSADNGQGTALWLAPVYRSFKAEDFDAQGREYGSDIDLYGAVLGLDVTRNKNLRIGAMVNLGEGDARGRNAGQGITNDFNFYSFGIYGGYAPFKDSKFEFDFSYSVVSNDLSADSGIKGRGQLMADTNSVVWSMGTGAQYTYNVNRDFMVAPHIALRYDIMDIEDYAVSLDGTEISSNSSEQIKLFTIPVGVSLAKEIKTQDWSFRPAVDFTVSTSLGDKEIASVMVLNGVQGADINYMTEVADTFTYSLSVGADIYSAENGFSLGLSSGYTFSSHTEDYGLNANLNYVF